MPFFTVNKHVSLDVLNNSPIASRKWVGFRTEEHKKQLSDLKDLILLLLGNKHLYRPVMFISQITTKPR